MRLDPEQQQIWEDAYIYDTRKKLTQREERICEMRFDERLTLAGIAKWMKVTPNRVSQMIATAIVKLRKENRKVNQ